MMADEKLGLRIRNYRAQEATTKRGVDRYKTSAEKIHGEPRKQELLAIIQPYDDSAIFLDAKFLQSSSARSNDAVQLCIGHPASIVEHYTRFVRPI